ncbi:LPS-assembly protein LptD [Sneathiella chinensis]|uniref:LPS-assembly protein LptD n=1 Tax=Sneathiella chinensis TaxID=349750 RepID=A0ABQ5U6Q1_9PROT|nr:LPS assembly protein LptD [Sneathiella chinensis]GLQ07568.1 LPS-assembly protein LptD [Sneathiella chinensis]
MRRHLVQLLASTFLVATAPALVSAQQVEKDFDLAKESLFSADNISYDRENEQVTAIGNVEIVQGERVLKADRVTYSVREDQIVAKGNIVLLEPTGEVLFADEIELQNELKTGAIRDIRVLFTDNSRLAAQSAVRVDENSTVMNNAVFSTCALCEEDKNAAPLWQVKARKVKHDKAEKQITYRDAVMEFYGVPVLYTPYFSFPDPTVDRKSGFLPPTIFDSSFLGYGATVPYYYVISDDKDLTISPTMTSKEGGHLALEYRQAVERGDYTLDGSITYVDERDSNGVKTGREEFQGHVRGVGEFDLDDTWAWGFDFFATSHDTYLDKYDISNEDSLTSTAYVQGLRGRNYTRLSAYTFQGLKAEDVTGETPFVPAWLEYSYVGEPTRLGARYSLDVDALTLVRTEGQDTNRVSVKGGWHLPYTSPSGQVLSLDASLRGDAYYALDQLEDPYDTSSETQSQFTGRVIPSLSMKWSYPFVRQAGSVRQLIEPVVEGVWSESLGSKETPNEDSLSFEFDDTNLFGDNRFAGLDAVEEGTRVNYGVNFGFYGAEGGYTTLLVGQTAHLAGDNRFGEGSGLEDRWSDYVARLEIQPIDYFKYTHRIRLDEDDLELARNEIEALVGTEENWLSLGYVRIGDEITNAGLEKRQEIFTQGRVKLADFWSAYGSYRRDLTDGGRSVEATFGLEYLDECFGFAIEGQRSFTRDRDVEPSTSIGFRIRLLPFN